MGSAAGREQQRRPAVFTTVCHGSFTGDSPTHGGTVSHGGRVAGLRYIAHTLQSSLRVLTMRASAYRRVAASYRLQLLQVQFGVYLFLRGFDRRPCELSLPARTVKFSAGLEARPTCRW